MEIPPPIRMRQIAERAGVSVMTVSRVLRGSRLVSEETRSRVEALVAEMGYRPDPVASRLMSVVRKGKKRSLGSVLAFVRVQSSAPIPSREIYHYIDLADVRQRAESHGYRVEEFILGPEGVRGARLQAIMEARGIEGALFSIESTCADIRGFDFSRFACATFGYALRSPALHRASTNMTQGLLTAVKRLEEMGRRRIGLAITEWIDARSEHACSGAMRHFQSSISSRDRVPPLIFAGKCLSEFREAYLTWARRHAPDAIITLDGEVPGWTRIPQDIVICDWTESAAGYPGISHNRAHVATAAVDLVATQLFHGERGIPEVPRQVLIPATWIAGTR